MRPVTLRFIAVWSARQRRVTVSASVLRTVSRSTDERLMTLSTSAVAVCCCSAVCADVEPSIATFAEAAGSSRFHINPVRKPMNYLPASARVTSAATTASGSATMLPAAKIAANVNPS